MNRWLPKAASAHAGAVDVELTIVHVLMLALFIGWMAYFAWVLFRYRRRRQPVPEGLTGGSEPPRSRYGRIAMWITGGVVAAEAVMLTVFALPMWYERQGPPPHDPQAIAVRVVAQQFAWMFHYPGADGKFGVTRLELVTPTNPIGLDRTAANGADDIVTGLLHLPVGRQAVLQLSSKDVVHSFGLPNFRVKQDVTPGMIGTVWFVPTVEGNFDIACSQLCGLGHYRMKSIVIVERAESFAKFLADEAAYLK
jgi:cytochrome c oxidase subunit 2